MTSASATLFKFNAPGWSDPEARVGIESALTYTFVYLSNPNDEKSKQVSLFTGTDISSYSTKLPEGYGDTGILKVAVLVVDEDGGQAISSWSSIYVKAEPLPVDKGEQEAIFDRIILTNVESAQNASQSSEVLAAANMISSALESGDVDEAVKTRTAAKLVNFASNAIETMGTDDAAVDATAQFVGTIASSAELDPSTTNKVLDITENLAAASESNGKMSKNTQDALAAALTVFMLNANAAASVEQSPVEDTGGGDGGDGGTDGNGGTDGGNVDKPTPPTLAPPKVDVKQVQRLQAAVTSVMSAVVNGIVPGADAVAIVTEAFVATLESARPSAMVKKPIESSTGLRIAVSADTFGGVVSGTDVQSLVVEFKNQPSLDNGTSTMGADGVRIVFKTNGTELKVTNLKEPNLIDVPLKIVPTWIRNKTLKKIKKVPRSMLINRTILPLLCDYIGQNHTITNCSTDASMSFNFTCIKKVQLYELVCPKMIARPECVYWNTVSNSWEKDGLTTIVDSVSGKIRCSSTHLTDFSVKVMTSFDAVDDIVAAPFDERVANPEELMALLYKNIVVVATMLITFITFIFSCCASRYYDAQDEYTIKKKRKKIFHIKDVWSASRGIISWKQLEQDVNKTRWYSLWWEGVKSYHPLLSIYFTHSLVRFFLLTFFRGCLFFPSYDCFANRSFSFFFVGNHTTTTCHDFDGYDNDKYVY